jgi:hypothetical protein
MRPPLGTFREGLLGFAIIVALGLAWGYWTSGPTVIIPVVKCYPQYFSNGETRIACTETYYEGSKR